MIDLVPMRYLALLVFAIVPVIACEEEEKATPQVIFEAGLGASNSAQCRQIGQLFEVGKFGNPNADPPVSSQAVRNGEAFGQGAADVGCTVAPIGADEFNVNATVRLTGAKGGLFKIDGKFKTTGDQANVHVLVSSTLLANQYEDHGCTVTYEASYRGVAAGRVWGVVKCPAAENKSAQTVCEVRGEFRFENCSQ